MNNKRARDIFHWCSFCLARPLGLILTRTLLSSMPDHPPPKTRERKQGPGTPSRTPKAEEPSEVP